ncbi:hypothetical protein DWB77_06255 [Streptomyces hundungensis]|uniref:Secreted protein n=1 Tax=Streptomyces hundungensis TaxID=1077946 RepID=A0A387HJK5_9ACTN|nr:DUF6167 family protein [Streptomyces hundungensis]AYG84046.1 hypothetical protein DWB77_06255 [Streptomyces hundungensis]
MFRRTFWFTAGAAAGVWATTKVNRKLKQLTPESLAARTADKAVEAGHRLKDFALDIKSGMAQREAELNDVLGIDGSEPRELPARRRLVALDTTSQQYTKQQHTKQQHTKHSYDRNEDH